MAPTAKLAPTAEVVPIAKVAPTAEVAPPVGAATAPTAAPAPTMEFAITGGFAGKMRAAPVAAFPPTAIAESEFAFAETTGPTLTVGFAPILVVELAPSGGLTDASARSNADPTAPADWSRGTTMPTDEGIVDGEEESMAPFAFAVVTGAKADTGGGYEAEDVATRAVGGPCAGNGQCSSPTCSS